MRRLDSSTSQAAATNRLAESQFTRATGATRTTPTRRSSSRSSSGSSSASALHQPGRRRPASPARRRRRRGPAPAAAAACRGGRVTGRAAARVADQRDREAAAVGAPGLRSGLEPGDADVARRRLVGTAHDERHAERRPAETALACRSVSSAISPGRDSVASTSPARPSAAPEIEPAGRDRQRGHLIEQRLPVARAAERRRRRAARARRRAWRGRAPAGRRLQLRQPRRPRDDDAAAGRVVDHQHERARRVPGDAASRQRRSGRGEHERDDEQRAEQQQQQVLQLEPALMLRVVVMR